MIPLAIAWFEPLPIGVRLMTVSAHAFVTWAHHFQTNSAFAAPISVLLQLAHAHKTKFSMKLI
jgi:hypothetical protein